MKALIELHFQQHFIENVLRSTHSYPNETSKECIQFLNTLFGIRSCGYMQEYTGIRSWGTCRVNICLE